MDDVGVGKVLANGGDNLGLDIDWVVVVFDEGVEREAIGGGFVRRRGRRTNF